MTRSTYRPATLTIDPTQPGGIDAILEFHRATFGDARMEDDPDPGDGERQPGGEAAEAGYPSGTPIAEMTAEQQAAYWKHKARKHEQRIKGIGDIDTLRARAARADELEAAALTDQEKAVADARAESEAQARADERSKALPRLFQAEFRAAAAGRIPVDKISGLVEPLNAQHFLTPEGEVDADKVQQYVDGIAPTGKSWPDMGQGRRGPASKADPREAGKAAAERRFGSKS